MTERASRSAGGERPLRVLLVEHPGRTSNEIDLFNAMPHAHVAVVADRAGWGTDDEIVLTTVKPPFVGDAFEAWTAVPAWYRHLDAQIVERADPDVIVSLELFSFATLQASRLARRHGIPHAVLVAETMADNPLYKAPPWSVISRRMRHRIDLFLCDTALAREHLVELGCLEERCRVVLLGVDTEVFHPARSLVREPIVLFVGALRADRGADKGVRDIVAACRLLRRRGFDDLRLRLVGDGHLRRELEQLASREPFLEVLPPVPRTDVPDLMRSSRTLVLASKRTWKWEEQFGFVLVEAMATGLPVVGTRSGAIPFVVPPQNPLVAEGDVEGLATALADVLGPRGEVVGAQNRADALERFDVRKQGRLLRDSLASVVQDRRASTADERSAPCGS